MEQGPEDGVGETVVVTIRDIVVEVDRLAVVFLHEPLVDDRSVLGVDVEARPSDPGEGHRFFATGQRGNKTTRGHFEVVFAFCILGDGDRETVGNHDEMLRVGNVRNPRDGRVGIERRDGHDEERLGRDWRGGLGSRRGFGEERIFILAHLRETPEDNPDISLISISGHSLRNSHKLSQSRFPHPHPLSLQSESIFFNPNESFILPSLQKKLIFRESPSVRRLDGGGEEKRRKKEGCLQKYRGR